MDTLPNIEVSKGTAPDTVKPSISRYNFGDGYSQRVANGINPPRRNWKITWSYLTPTEKTTLEDFFIAKNGVTAFLWTPPLETAARKFTCPDWDFVPHGGSWYAGQATFTEEFDL